MKFWGWAKILGGWRLKTEADTREECRRKLARIPAKDGDGAKIEKLVLPAKQRPAK